MSWSLTVRFVASTATRSRIPYISASVPTFPVHCRCLHHCTKRWSLVQSVNTQYPPLVSMAARHISTTSLYKAQIPPDAASIADGVLETSSQEIWAADAARILAEGETFASLGLNNYSPVGLIQASMEFIYNTTGMPWWGAIVASTICLRVLFIPLTVFLQKNSIRMHNVNPQVKEFKEKQQMYMLAGDMEMAGQERNKMNKVFRENGIRPVLSLFPALFQGVFFVSYFMAIRGMAYAPVTSMMAGGALWFPDLTMPDPSFILPIMSCAGFLISLELGGEAGIANPQMEKVKYGMRLLSLLMIGITAKFPAGVFIYWLTSTSFSIISALLLRVSAVRGVLGMGHIAKHPEPAKSESTWSTMKEARKTKMLVESEKSQARKAKKRHDKQKKDKNPVLYQKPQPTSS